jgi:RHS repeat-associated protein
MSWGYRYYDSQTGRFTSTDKAPPNLGNPQTINQYAYVMGNPVVYGTVTGECTPTLTRVSEPRSVRHLNL